MMKISYNSYYVELSEKSDNDADRLYWMISAVRGKYPPHVFRTEPKWYERKKRKCEKVFIEALDKAIGPIVSDFSFTDDEREAYWTEIRRGQYPNEDAGGYSVRCLNGLLTGEVTEPGESYDQLMSRLLKEKS